MAASKELLSSSLIQIPSLSTNRSSLFLSGDRNNLSLPSKRRCFHSVKKKTYSVNATATTERFMEAATRRMEEEEAVEFTVRASVTVRRKVKEGVKETITKQFDALSDKIGRSVVLELVSNEIDARSKKAKTSKRGVLKDWYEKKSVKLERVVYTAYFKVDSNFGGPGAITVVNRHQKEFFLESIVVEGFAGDPIHFTCNSWVQPTRVHQGKRVFFSNKPYLPSETPPGLRKLRERELEELRGDGDGERKLTDRVYDYATYNDLGNPDKGFEFARPILGGEKIPYPRRCRTGRPPTDTDLMAESRVEDPNPIYVPRDEAFEEAKQNMLSAGALKALLHSIVPQLVASISPESRDFSAFHEIDNLYKEGIRLKQGVPDHLWKKIPFASKIHESSEGLLRYDTPHIISSK